MLFILNMLFIYLFFLLKGYVLSGEIALKNNHYCYYFEKPSNIICISINFSMVFFDNRNIVRGFHALLAGSLGIYFDSSDCQLK